MQAGAGDWRCVAGLRKDYGQASLNEDEVAGRPDRAIYHLVRAGPEGRQVNEPNAMSVATVDADGRPSSRIVLIKQFDERGFTWYTNYDSRKGQRTRKPIRMRPCCSSGANLNARCGSKAGSKQRRHEESDKYFHSRPLKSRLAAIASAQSAPIANRAALEQH